MKPIDTDAGPALRIKGSTLSATVLEVARAAPELIERELADKLAQAPQLFQNSPVVLALDKLDGDAAALDLEALLALCRRNSLHPVGVRALRPDDLAQAASLGLAILPVARARERTLLPDDTPAPVTETAANTDAGPVPSVQAPPRATRLVTQPVRGGQQIYAQGDLILLAAVSAGAEVMADGHIHIYAPLRGRALAGVQGDTEARIFCRELQAELVAVAGHYRIADDLKTQALWGCSAQVFLKTDELNLALL